MWFLLLLLYSSIFFLFSSIICFWDLIICLLLSSLHLYDFYIASHDLRLYLLKLHLSYVLSILLLFFLLSTFLHIYSYAIYLIVQWDICYYYIQNLYCLICFLPYSFSFIFSYCSLDLLKLAMSCRWNLLESFRQLVCDHV